MSTIQNANGLGTSIEQMTDRHFATQQSDGTDRQAAFSEVMNELKFSKHAVKRLDDRQISLSDDQNKRLSQGVAKAGEKGVQDSLVMVDSLAFIVNVPTQTVITAMDEQETMDHIFTNIDGTVIA
ncbi:MAG: flagellar protein [Lachnospiraceae bacterium]|nr:flagellar protein [Lachnospiraceae bacterium]